MKNLILTNTLIFSLIISVDTFAQVYETANSGSWTNSSTWVNGEIPAEKANNITVKINEGHTVTFNPQWPWTQGKIEEIGNGVSFIINGSLELSYWKGFKTGNDVSFDISGSMINKSPIDLGNNNIFKVGGSYTNSSELKGKNGITFKISESGTMTNNGKFVLGNNSEFVVEGSLIINNWEFKSDNNTSFSIAENGYVENNGSVKFGKDLDLVIEGYLLNNGWDFLTDKNAEVFILEDGAMISNTEMQFEDILTLFIEGYLYVGGYDFTIGSSSEIYLLGKMEVENHWVFKSNRNSSYLFVCNGDDLPENINKNTIIIDTECGVLPVELIAFSAHVNNNNTELTWATATETNSDYFAVERSIDGFSWETITYLQSAGNSNQVVEYSYTDENLAAGMYYYRLKQVDLDGAFEYFSPIVAEILSTTEFQVKRVEKAGERVTLTANFEAGAKLVVFDAMGNLISSETFSFDTTTHSFRFSDDSGIIVINYVNAITGVISSSKYMAK